MLERFGQKLKKAREERKVSQRNLGMLLGLSDKAISSYESGRTLPTLETLIRLSEELNKPMVYFLDDNFVQESLIDKINEMEIELKHISDNIRDVKKMLIENEDKCVIQTPSVTPNPED